MLPVCAFVKFMSHHGFDVDDKDCLTNLGYKDHWTDSTELLREGLWQDDQVISTDRCQLNIESIFVIVSRILFIVTDQLFCMLLPAENIILNEVSKSLSV